MKDAEQVLLFNSRVSMHSEQVQRVYLPTFLL